MSRHKWTNRQVDMLHGSIGDKAMAFALSLAATGILQQLFNAADTAVIGRFVGKNAMAAVGCNSPVIGLLVNGFIGISLGANVVISRFTGQGNKEGIHGGVHTAITFALISGIALTIFGECIAAPFLKMLSIPEEVFSMALLYLRVYLAGLPVIFLYNFESAIFRSQGDTKTPLLCLFTSGVINVILNLFFVLVVGMTVDGVALATVLSNLISSGMLFFFLLHSKTEIRVRRQEFRINGRILRDIIRIGLPSGMQSMVFSLSNICVQSAINSLGADVMAASSAAFNIEIIPYFFVNSFGQACTTFIGQNYGAGNKERCRRITRICLVQDMIVSLVVSVLFVAGGVPLLHIFNTDPQVVAMGMIRLRFILLAEVINAVIEVLSGTMRGYGHSLIPALIAFFGICGSRITWVYTVFRAHPDFHTLMTIYPVSWIITASVLAVAYVIFLKKVVMKERGTRSA